MITYPKCKKRGNLANLRMVLGIHENISKQLRLREVGFAAKSKGKHAIDNYNFTPESTGHVLGLT